MLIQKTIETPLGEMFAVANEKGICLLGFIGQKKIKNQLKDLQKRFGHEITSEKNTHLLQTKKELAEYFSGKRKNFSVSLDPQGTDFQKTVWKTLQKIPYGETRSYREEAQMMEHPKAIRAVANGNGSNKISIIIPCHRVIGADGSLTGYGGGMERKKWLLDLEQTK